MLAMLDKTSQSPFPRRRGRRKGKEERMVSGRTRCTFDVYGWRQLWLDQYLFWLSVCTVPLWLCQDVTVARVTWRNCITCHDSSTQHNVEKRYLFEYVSQWGQTMWKSPWFFHTDQINQVIAIYPKYYLTLTLAFLFILLVSLTWRAK